MKWDNDDFLTKIARPFVGKQIAIVSDSIVQSTPTINPGITGSNIGISGNFGRTGAVNLASSIMGIASSAVHVQKHPAAPHRPPREDRCKQPLAQHLPRLTKHRVRSSGTPCRSAKSRDSCD